MPSRANTILSGALIEGGLMEKSVLEPLLKEAESTNSDLKQIILKRGLLGETEMLGALAKNLKVAFVELDKVSLDKKVLDRVPVKIASYYKFLPIEIKDRVLTVAVSGPLDIKTQDEIQTQLGLEIEIVLASSHEILEALKRHYGFAAETLEKITSTVPKDTVAFRARNDSVEDIEKLAEDASVIKLVNQIILEGWKKRATDIHLEPYRDTVNLRYRVDGMLYDSNVSAEIKSFLNSIISRIKIMSNLNIVERRLPQDGRAIVKVQEQMLDLRISTIPTPFGESVVIRILPAHMLFDLEKLGLAKRDLHIFEDLIRKPHGIIFVTGPTGSGKTTTLYASLSRINTKDRKIITIEDPIEYEMSGITQIQVMPEIGLDFARGLRSILRHDPDVIMVGEVRDLETAEIAIRVALTGHLVFSTLHTNDAASGITRLLDIGVEPYLLASSVIAFIAQRLIRVICPDCKYEDKEAPKELREIIAHDLKLDLSEVKIYRGKGCSDCNFTGYFGRTAIYEILPIDEEIIELILKKASSDQLERIAISRNMHTLREDGWQKTILGITTPEEVMRVTSAEEPQAKKNASEENSPVAFKDEESKDVSGEEEEDLDSAAERRRYRRLDSKVNVSYEVVKSKDELVKRGYKAEQFSVSKNISASGLLFYANEPVPIGSILDCKIQLPNSQNPIRSLARVVRVDETGQPNSYNIAVCFLDITGAERSKLDKFVEAEFKKRIYGHI